MDIYEMILEELNKGNAVYVEAEYEDQRDGFRGERFRIVTPKSCEYSSLTGIGSTYRSCFLEYANVSADNIVKTMRLYDSRNGILIKTFGVL